MFERMIERVARISELRARESTKRTAERLRDQLPGGVAVEEVAGGVQLSGRRLRRRAALDPALRWLGARVK